MIPVSEKSPSIDVYDKGEERLLASYYFDVDNKFTRLVACNRAAIFVESISRLCGYDSSRFLLWDTFDNFSWSI